MARAQQNQGRGRGRSAEAMRMVSLATQYVRKSVREGEKSMAHTLAFGTGADGQAHSDASRGLAEIWLTQEGIQRIQQKEREKIGRKLGTRPARTTTTS